MPDVAVGKEAVGAGLAGRVSGHIAALLVFGPLGAGLAFAFQVMPQGFGFQDGAGRPGAGQGGGGVPEDDVGAVAAGL